VLPSVGAVTCEEPILRPETLPKYQIADAFACSLEMSGISSDRDPDSPDRDFSWFSQSLRQMPREYIKICHDFFLITHFKSAESSHLVILC
jgi:hypothetical protein